MTQLFFDFKNKNVWVLGAGKSGISSAKLLLKHGAKVTLVDEKIENLNKENFTEFKNSITFLQEKNSENQFLNQCDILVVSPGIPLNKSLCYKAKMHNKPIIGELDIAYNFLISNCNHKKIDAIGITGTNGKSTTTSYLDQLYNKNNIKSSACGNIGVTLSEVVITENNCDKYVVEVSSYQCETINSFLFSNSCLLNIQNDHQERYLNLDEYLKAKWRLILLTAPQGIAVIHQPVLLQAIRQGLPWPRCKIFTMQMLKNEADFVRLQSENKNHSNLIGHFENLALPQSSYGDLAELHLNNLIHNQVIGVAAVWQSDNKKLGIIIKNPTPNQVQNCNSNTPAFCKWEIQHPCLDGEHNALNLLAANTIALHNDVSLTNVKQQWEAKTSSFVPLAHRLEVVATTKQQCIDAKGHIKNVKIINDSKATNVQSVTVALKTVQGAVRLLLGGRPKGDGFASLKEFYKNPIVKIYPFGEAGIDIFKELREPNIVLQPCSSLKEALEKALCDAQNNDIILLSPGCSSYDEFQNFEHRGNCFKEWVQQSIV